MQTHLYFFSSLNRFCIVSNLWASNHVIGRYLKQNKLKRLTMNQWLTKNLHVLFRYLKVHWTSLCFLFFFLRRLICLLCCLDFGRKKISHGSFWISILFRIPNCYPAKTVNYFIIEYIRIFMDRFWHDVTFSYWQI